MFDCLIKEKYVQLRVYFLGLIKLVLNTTALRMLHLVYLITSFFVSRCVVIKRARHESCRYQEGSSREVSLEDS